jgi:hypothetical protein
VPTWYAPRAQPICQGSWPRLIQACNEPTPPVPPQYCQIQSNAHSQPPCARTESNLFGTELIDAKRGKINFDRWSWNFFAHDWESSLFLICIFKLGRSFGLKINILQYFEYLPSVYLCLVLHKNIIKNFINVYLIISQSRVSQILVQKTAREPEYQAFIVRLQKYVWNYPISRSQKHPSTKPRTVQLSQYPFKVVKT